MRDEHRRSRVVAAVAEELAAVELALRTQLRMERAALLDVVTRQRTQIDRLQRQLDAARAEIRRYKQAARVRFDAVFEQIKAEEEKKFDVEERQARRELANPPPIHDILASDRERLDTVARLVHRQAALIAESNALSMVSAVSDPDELQRVFDAAELSGQESVMVTTTSKMEAIAKRARSQANLPSPRNNPAVRAATDMRERLERFRAEHPSPTDRLRAIATKRRQAISELERAKGHWFRVYGWRDTTRNPAA